MKNYIKNILFTVLGIIITIVVIYSYKFFNSYNKENNIFMEVAVEKENQKTSVETSEKSDNGTSSEENNQKNEVNNSSTTNSIKEKEVTNPNEKKIVLEGIPITSKKVLNVVGQIQKERVYCAPTAVSMMLSALGKNVDQYTLAKDMGTYEPFGTHNKDAIRILNKYLFGYEYPQENQNGYRLETVNVVDNNTLKLFKERVKKNIDDGYPMYYTMDVSKVYPGLRGEHNVIGTGYALDEKGELAILYYIDPSPAVQDKNYGGLRVITPEKLLTSMLTCEERNYAW